mmetsp:Transcript_39599/g.60577  ORF Transcript_39599/g.60577 Transcript_39599/m.60577 type:complete len:106 (+) Transcript_39599:835-1152(+)
MTLQDDGWTALHLATKTSSPFCKYLIEDLGANVLLRNRNGVSLMHKAALDDNTYMITYLRDKCQMGLSEVDFEGNTPLHFACSVGAENAVYWLIGFGQDVNAINN